MERIQPVDFVGTNISHERGPWGKRWTVSVLATVDVSDHIGHEGKSIRRVVSEV